jgi:hypothetical protein
MVSLARLGLHEWIVGLAPVARTDKSMGDASRMLKGNSRLEEVQRENKDNDAQH